MNDEYYMRKALEQARMAYDKDEVPVGAVVVCRDRIIARAYNLTETLNDVTAHAEMQAITAAADALNGKYLDVCTLYYVCRGYRVGTDGTCGIRSQRPQTGVQRVCSQGHAPQNRSGVRGA